MISAQKGDRVVRILHASDRWPYNTSILKAPPPDPQSAWLLFNGGVAVAPSGVHGRGVFATKAFAAGDVIFIEGAGCTSTNLEMVSLVSYAPELFHTLMPRREVVTQPPLHQSLGVHALAFDKARLNHFTRDNVHGDLRAHALWEYGRFHANNRSAAILELSLTDVVQFYLQDTAQKKVHLVAPTTCTINGADNTHPCNVNLHFTGIADKSDAELSGIPDGVLSNSGKRFLDSSKLALPIAIGVARTAISRGDELYVEYGSTYADGTGHAYADPDFYAQISSSQWAVFEKYASALGSVPRERITSVAKRIAVSLSVARQQCEALEETYGKDACANKFT